MDDYFQYLIYLFIIISFLSSIFRKKGKPQSKPEEPTPSPPVKPQRSTSQEDYDILKEIENMFKTQSPQAEAKPEKISIEGRKHETDSEYLETEKWDEEIQSEHGSTSSEHRLENWEDKRKKIEERKRQTLNEKIVKQAEIFEKNLMKKRQVVDVSKTLKQKFKRPSTLKEYVIISEILGKPKAFQE